MAPTVGKRDYSLGGEGERAAIAAGLANGDWYRSPIDPGTLQELSQRSNGPATRNAALYLTLLIGSGVAAYLTLWSWWSIPLLFLYGTLYGSASDPRWHECGHGTAFKTEWPNTVLYFPASFMLLRDPTVWRWSHVRHHSDTIIVGRDPEIVLQRPPNMLEWLGGFLLLPSGLAMLARTARHSMGRIADAERSYIPERELSKVAWEARAFVALILAVIVWCITTVSLVPLLFFVGPTFYGAWLMRALGTTQHLGLQEDVLDHRLNTRTIYMNPVLRFLYWNMNYHTEHHLFPTVPSHALPKLHSLIKDDLPEPQPSMIAAYREIVPALLRQRKDPEWEIERRIPGLGESTRPRPDTPGGTALSFTAIPTGRSDWVDVCGVDALTDGQVARVDHGDTTYALYRLDGDYFATDGICTHSRQVHLADGLVIDDQIECPKHNGRFRITDGWPTRAPVRDAIQCRSVRVEGTRVQLQSASATQEDLGDSPPDPDQRRSSYFEP